MADVVGEKYGNRLRVRACGILVENNRLLMVNHRSLAAKDFWAPPGGGVDFGESLPDTLKRELREETGLETEVEKFLFTTEFIKPPLHAVELFFLIRRTGGSLITGFDPEMKEKDQIIRDVRFLSFPEIAAMDPGALHGLFRFAGRLDGISRLSGYFRI